MINFPRILLMTLMTLCALGCQRPPDAPVVKQSREVMGTLAQVTAIANDDEAARRAVEAAYARLDDVNRLMSDYIADSEIGRLNQLSVNESRTVSDETFTCLTRALEIAERSGGAFDVTCRPLVALWRQAAKRDSLPTEAELTAVRAAIGSDKLTLDAAGRTITLLADGLQIDLGGIAKGYALDLAAEAMQSAGATGGLVDVGGDIVAFGTRRDGRPWRVGVRHPFEPGLIAQLEVTDSAVATSGLQQRFFEIQGERYSHIVDPRTGRPAAEAPSVTVIADDGTTADAWATVFSVMPVADGQTLLGTPTAPPLEVLWITGPPENPTLRQTSGFERYLTR